MLKYVIDHFKRRVLKDNRGFLQFLAPLLPSIIGAGASLLGGKEDEGEKVSTPTNIFQQLPGYAESDAARGEWWKKLQEFGDQPGYGAIAPNWADVWSMAQQRVHDYFRGTATQPGALQRVKASAARRNVSDSPALQTNIAALGAEEGRQIGDLAKEQSLAESMFSEQGRQSWLQNLSSLTQQKPAFFNQGQSTEQQAGKGDLISSLGGLLGNALGTDKVQDWLGGLLK